MQTNFGAKYNYPKNFNFRAEFSSKSDGTTYIPWRNTNENSNISNYVVHKSSIQAYNVKNKKPVSYIIKGINSWFIVGKTFVKQCNFRKNFFIVGIAPHFKYWTRKTEDAKLKKFNQSFKGTTIFQDMINLEKYDIKIWITYENKLTKLFDKAITERQNKIKKWEELKNYLNIDTNPKTYNNLDPDYENSSIINKHPPFKEYDSDEWQKLVEETFRIKKNKN